MENRKLRTNYIIFLIRFRSRLMREYRLPFTANIEPLGISLAPLAQISIYMYIISLARFRSHFMCEYRLPIGKYRAALRHITCAVGANIDLHKYPLIHRRRDGGPPAPRRSRPLFVTPKACHLSRYRESLPHLASQTGEGR